MIDFKDFYKRALENGLGRFEDEFRCILDTRFHQHYHGELSHWLEAIAALPAIAAQPIQFGDSISISSTKPIEPQSKDQLLDCLKLFHPWRKGPFNLFGIEIDTEWRSNLKWQRVLPHIQSLKNRKILDIGCGNAYYGWQMLAEQPRWVLGVDPSQKFMMQFLIMKRFANNYPIDYLPLRGEDLPARMAAFDTVFSMGVLYHRRSPFDHLEELKQCLVAGGELVLETLVIEGGQNHVLVPANRYAQMRNVWFIPSITTLAGWLERVGFDEVKLVDISQTTTTEQRTTDWMRFHSLEDYLAPDNPNLTIEGYPAPLRATFVARNPR